MPNHVTHRIVVSGPTAAVAEFKNKHLVTTSGTDETTGKPWQRTDFDFNTVIPMPKILEGTESGSREIFGYELVTGKPLPQRFGESSILTAQWVKDLLKGKRKTIAALRTYLKKNKPADYEDYIKAGELAVKAQKETGHCDWYSWCVAHWDTKWNAYSFKLVKDESGRVEFMFDTAWSTPEPVFRRLAEMWPQLTIKYVGFDEGWGFATLGELKDGRADLRETEATDALYEMVYGEKPKHEDE